jgi:hypothetical protein
MSESKNINQAQTPRAAESRDDAKKPYVKPAFRHEQVFETMALACGKKNSTQAQCRTSRKNS